MSETESPLFRPLTVRSLELRNRIVMSPMTRSHSPGGVPGPDVVEYYRRRAAGGTALIVTEGVAIEHPTAVDNPRVPHMYGEAALEGWRRVVDAVHAEGGRIVPQLWHVGPLWGAMSADVDPDLVPMRPSGIWGELGVTSYGEDYIARASAPTRAMTAEDIEQVVAAYADAAAAAAEAGFDGIALHGGHGYLLDAFLWEGTNLRDDEWGGDLERRTRFPATVVAAIRSRIGNDLPIFYRFSQHKQQNYEARIAHTPDELKAVLTPLKEAGVDVFDASIRRFDLPAFEGSDLTLAGWAKKVTGAHSMAVGSVGIATTLRESRLQGSAPARNNVPKLERRLGDDEFDLIAIGRLHLADPSLATTLRNGAELPEFDRSVHEAALI
ncbi:12-oxophytodienoate reductase [Rhodococcus rhodochrous]|uniref:12-oxophytodienoate reductase n=1 Tax=Rhodococcus rhodochrous TaxID=1829 RepID=A0AAW4XBY2_RHORH|nr:12-oxophytodienoate reductase [Rhodococcus rhodochrous]MCD2110433.1 12-oxophytodienoate reductase [Rhodococcus rhodochrous]